MHVTRLRQVVVAAHDRDAIGAQVEEAFGLGLPFHDPGVGDFGLHNSVYPIGDTFFEIVSPVRENTTAGRYLERHGGDAGYMVIFQVADIAAARDHLRAEQCRTVWSGDHATISGTHLHPADIGGAIVSVDEPRPPASWLWAGPSWEANVRTDVVTSVVGCTMADADPRRLAANWSRLLNLPLGDADGAPTLHLPDGSTVRFVATADAGGRSGLVGIDLRASAAAGATDPVDRMTIAGVEFTLRR